MSFLRWPKAFLRSHYEITRWKKYHRNKRLFLKKKKRKYQTIAVNTFWLAYSGNKCIHLTICQHYYFVSILMSPSSTISSLCMIMTVIEVCICFGMRQLFNIHVCSFCTWSGGRILDPFSLTWPGIPDLSEEFLNDVSKMKLQAFLIDFQD